MKIGKIKQKRTVVRIKGPAENTEALSKLEQLKMSAPKIFPSARKMKTKISLTGIAKHISANYSLKNYFALSSLVVNKIRSLFREGLQFYSGRMKVILLTISFYDSHPNSQQICTQKNTEQRDQ
jgi:hypothetical protein